MGVCTCVYIDREEIFIYTYMYIWRGNMCIYRYKEREKICIDIHRGLCTHTVCDSYLGAAYFF